MNKHLAPLSSLTLIFCLLTLPRPLQAQATNDLATLGHDIVAAYNTGDTSRIEGFFSDDYVLYTNGTPGEGRGPAGVRAHVESLRTTYPDFKLTADDSFATSERVVLRWTFEGTNKQFDKAVAFPGTWIGEIENGKVVRGWQAYDTMTPSLQLGGTYTPPGS